MEELAEAANLLESRAQATGMMTVAQAATYLQVTDRTVWRWVAQGKIRAAKLSPRVTRITRRELDDFIASRTPH